MGRHYELDHRKLSVRRIQIRLAMTAVARCSDEDPSKRPIARHDTIV